MRVYCKKDFMLFHKGEYYDIANIQSIFMKNDYITIYINKEHNEKGPLYRFALIKHLGNNEIYFCDYFYTLQEERRIKLKKINL